VISFVRFAVIAAWLVATPARAAEGIFLNWNDCPLGVGATSDLTNLCSTNAGQSELICSFSLAQAVDSVLAVEITIDLQHSEAALPEWWRFDQSPCRANALGIDGNFAGRNACEDMWHGEPVAGGLAQYTVGLPRGQVNQARIKLTLAVTPERMQPRCEHDLLCRAVGDRQPWDERGPTCAGCSTPGLVLNAIRIGRPPRLRGPDANVLPTRRADTRTGSPGADRGELRRGSGAREDPGPDQGALPMTSDRERSTAYAQTPGRAGHVFSNQDRLVGTTTVRRALLVALGLLLTASFAVVPSPRRRHAVHHGMRPTGSRGRRTL
jgi:hypothetical protein